MLNSTLPYKLTESRASLTAWDFTVLVLFLLISTLVGVYFMIQDRKRKKRAEEATITSYWSFCINY